MLSDLLGFQIEQRHVIIAALAISFCVAAWLLMIILEAISRNVRRISRNVRRIDKAQLKRETASALERSGSALSKESDRAIFLIRPFFDFSGSLGRLKFAVIQLLVSPAMLVILFVLSIGIDASLYGGITILARFFLLALLVVFFLLAWISIASCFKRMRDTGVSVWWTLMLAVPPVNLATWLFLLFVPTDEFKSKPAA